MPTFNLIKSMKSLPLKHEVPLVTLVSPAHIRRNIEKALDTAQNTTYATVLDLEDGVPHDKKGEAIENTTHYLNQTGNKPIWVRTNPINGDRKFNEDINFLREFIEAEKIKGFHIPKITSPKDIDEVIRILDGLPPINLSFIIETKLALQHLNEILDIIQATKSAIGISIGWEDISQEYGIFKPENIFENELLKDIAVEVVRSATTRNIAVQDGINRAFGNIDTMKPLAKQAREMSQMGANGKIAIHPSQISVIENSFKPTKQQVKWANEVIACVQEKFGSVENYIKSPGPFNFNNSMGAIRIVMQALQVLDQQKI